MFDIFRFSKFFSIIKFEPIYAALAVDISVSAKGVD